MVNLWLKANRLNYKLSSHKTVLPRTSIDAEIIKAKLLAMLENDWEDTTSFLFSKKTGFLCSTDNCNQKARKRTGILPGPEIFLQAEHSLWIWGTVQHQLRSIPEGCCPAAAFHLLPSLFPMPQTQSKVLPLTCQRTSILFAFSPKLTPRVSMCS